MSLELGCVVQAPEEVGPAASLSVDYLEVKGDMLCVPPAELRAVGAALRATGLPVAAMTSPLPRRFGCRVVGPGADPTRALQVFTDMCDRGADLGVAVVVLGSGQARSVPEGFPAGTATDQFRAFLVAAAAECRNRAMTLTLEPLTASETNHINSPREARAVLADLDGAEVGIAVDCYHLISERLPVSAEVAAVAGAIGHAHTSSFPRGSLDFQPEVQAEFVTSLVAAGYTGRLSVEENFGDFATQAPPALRMFREIIARCG